MNATRPVTRYYGGKWRIAPQIVALMPPHEVYVEPFGGAASVLLRKRRATCEVYNDVYEDVVNTFRVLRDSPAELVRGLFLTPYARDEYRRAYEATADPVEAARRFIFRSTAGIGSNSSYKLNGFRTSMADMRHVTATSFANLPVELWAIAERLRGVIIENRDAVKVMRQYDHEHTLHYVDPPYLGDVRSDGARGYLHEMKGVGAHEELLEVLKGLSGKVMVSGYATEEYAAALTGWSCVEIKARDQSNRRRTEVVWMNFEQEGLLGLWG